MLRPTLPIALVVVSLICLPSCHQGPDSTESTADSPTAPVADKPFVANGKINLDVDGGGYDVKASADNHIRVAASDTKTTKVDVAIEGNQAIVKIKDTPHSNFRAIVEVPAAADLVVRLSGGELKIDAITGNKDVESTAGNVRIAVGNASDYAQVEAAVKAGELDAAPFGGSKSGLMQNFTWSGPGKHTLRAHLGAGNLTLTGK